MAWAAMIPLAISAVSAMGKNDSKPYGAALEQYEKYLGQAKDYQAPFYNSGVSAIPKYEEWAERMKDPSAFINQEMGNYQESPWAKFSQQEGMRAGTNAASASGLGGSTPMMQQLQQNSQNISSQDMQSWLQNVLGINNTYGQSQQNLMGQGANAANSITNMIGQFGPSIAEAAFGQSEGENNIFSQLFGGNVANSIMPGMGNIPGTNKSASIGQNIFSGMGK